jgi:hypothetical protein
MSAAQFLSSYCFFTAAVSAYQNTPENERAVPDQRAIVRAFKKATDGMSEKDQKPFIEYVQYLLQQPEDFKREEFARDFAKLWLDRELGKKGAKLIDGGGIVPVAEFIVRANTNHEVLTQKLRERRIFKMPEWVNCVWSEDYYPAFFADPRYDLALLETVSKALRADNGAAKFRFFTTPNAELENKTPLEVLAGGDLERVLAAVKTFRKRA